MSTHPDLKFNTPTWQVERDPEYNLLVGPVRHFLGTPWFESGHTARVVRDGGDVPSLRNHLLGFRLVRDSMAPEVKKE